MQLPPFGYFAFLATWDPEHYNNGNGSVLGQYVLTLDIKMDFGHESLEWESRPLVLSDCKPSCCISFYVRIIHTLSKGNCCPSIQLI